MATPTPMKHALSQQGKTPSQSQQGAAATPPVSTPFSVAAAAISPHGAKSSPQQVKKSPATASTVMGHPSTAPVNYDSPSAAAVFTALQTGSGLDLGLGALGSLQALGRASDDERLKRLEDVIATLGRSNGLVSEAGLERLAKRMGLESMWETGMGDGSKKTLIVAGHALELLVDFVANIVQSVSLSFPDSAEIVNKHAEAAGKILLANLQLDKDQSPLTKTLDDFAANFERLATLDRLSINPGLNLYEAVAGIYESLARLHTWERQRARQDLAVAGKPDAFVDRFIMCTKSGIPRMNARGRVGLVLDFWHEKRLYPPAPTPEQASLTSNDYQIWSMSIGCAPLRDIGVGPVRVSDKWIGVDVEKVPLPDELPTGIVDWLEPESTFVPPSDQAPPEASLLGPRLPEVTFLAAFDPPIHIPLGLLEHIQQLGCGVQHDQQLKTLDLLLFPADPKTTATLDSRTIVCKKKVAFMPPGEGQEWETQSHVHSLSLYKPELGRTLSELTFSHPQQLINILPYLRQYTFLETLLRNTFTGEDEKPPAELAREKAAARQAEKESLEKKAKPTVRTVVSGADAYEKFAALSMFRKTLGPSFGEDLTHLTAMGGNKSDVADGGAMDGETDGATEGEGSTAAARIDVTLTILPVPRLEVFFPFRDGTGYVTFKIRENGSVYVSEQSVLDETNRVATNGRVRNVQDLARLLETLEDLGKWAEFVRTRWA